MSFKIHVNGVVVEAETAHDAQALIAAFGRPHRPLPSTEGNAAPRARVAQPRGASNGALEGRILSALEESGSVAPGALAKQVKVDRYNLGRAIRALVERGLVRADGHTSQRRYTLAKKKGGI